METIPLEDGKGTSPFGGVPGGMTDRHPAVLPLNAARLVTTRCGARASMNMGAECALENCSVRRRCSGPCTDGDFHTAAQ